MIELTTLTHKSYLEGYKRFKHNKKQVFLYDTSHLFWQKSEWVSVIEQVRPASQCVTTTLLFVLKELLPHVNGKVYGGWYLQKHEAAQELEVFKPVTVV